MAEKQKRGLITWAEFYDEWYNNLKQMKEGSSTPQIAMKRLTLAQVDENRKKGLCFKCDEPYTTGHKCKQKSFMMIEHEDLES